LVEDWKNFRRSEMITARTKYFSEFVARHGKEGLRYLTPREEKIVTMLVDGKSYDEIGTTFAVSGSCISRLAAKAEKKARELVQDWQHEARIAPVADPIKQFFLEASAKTYASGEIKKTTIGDLPGSKVYRYEGDNLLYIDTYFTNGERSGGEIVIYHKDADKWQPAWLMQYHGWCKNDDSEVLAYLKQALENAYLKGIFHGGRGVNFPENVLESHPIWYRNNPYGSFESGYGEECIYRGSDKVFWHKYQHYMLASA
jgi:hypothetical protein